MKRLICLFVLLNFISICSSNTQFSIPLIQKTRSRLEVQQYFAQKETLNKEAPNTESLNKRGSRLLLNNYPHDYISVNISIGTPPQIFEVAVETGRPDLWVLGQYYDYVKPGQRVYYPNNSTTSSYYDYFEGQSANLVVYGEAYVDWLNLGDVSFNQTFGVVTEIFSGGDSNGFLVEGVVGLSWNDDEDYDSPIQNLLKIAGGGEEQIYTIWLGTHIPPSRGNGLGELSIGVDTSNCDASINYVNLVPFGRYMTFDVTGFTFGKYSSSTTKKGVVDSGFPIVMFNTDDYRVVYRGINPDYDWDNYLLTIDCSAASNLTSWEFTIGDEVYSIPSSQYVLDLELESGQCAVAFGLNENTYDIPDYAFGNVFIRQYCTTYNIKTTQIGLSASLSGTK